MAPQFQLDPIGNYGSHKEAKKILDKAREILGEKDPPTHFPRLPLPLTEFVHVLNEEIPHVPKALVGPILRMAFHDAGTFQKDSQTGGANGSFRFEVFDPFNKGMGPGFLALVAVHTHLHLEGCYITWADLFQVAGAVMVERTGGPHIEVELGRKDVLKKDEDFQTRIPSSTFNAKQLIANMRSKGFNEQEIVALSGAHTVGFSVNHKPIGPMKKKHETILHHVTHPLETLDEFTHAKEAITFDNHYYKNLLKDKEGRFPSDTALLQDPELLKWVEAYAQDQDLFFKDFQAAYLKMGLLGVKPVRPIWISWLLSLIPLPNKALIFGILKLFRYPSPMRPLFSAFRKLKSQTASRHEE